MRIHRVHTRQSLEPGRQARIVDKSAHYLRRVLRITTGQQIILFNGDGYDYLAEVEQPGKRELLLSILGRTDAAGESRLDIQLVQAISRGERMDQTLQKCTELGAASFQPLFSERVEVRLRAEKLERRVEHWQAVVISACEQSGRAFVPQVLEPVIFAEWLEAGCGGQCLVLAPDAETPLARVDVDTGVTLVVGPEGGFSNVELDLMEARGARFVSLGPRVLRTETAAPAAVAVLQSRAGDFA